MPTCELDKKYWGWYDNEVMPPIKDARRERYAQLLFSRPGEAKPGLFVEAGYTSANAEGNAYRIARRADIMERVAELQSEVAKDNIMSVQERKEILSEIARGNLIDYQSGYSEGSPNTRSVRKIINRVRIDQEGNQSHESIVELDDRKAAIAELNKMDGIYIGVGDIDVSDATNLAASIWSALKSAKKQQLEAPDQSP